MSGWSLKETNPVLQIYEAQAIIVEKDQEIKRLRQENERLENFNKNQLELTQKVEKLERDLASKVTKLEEDLPRIHKFDIKKLRSSEGNTYEEPSSAVKKREQKMFEPRETLPLVKKEEGKKKNSQESICSIKCGLLILFILLTSALSLLFCLHYLEVVKLPDRGLKTREVDTQKETMLNKEIRKLKSDAAVSNFECRYTFSQFLSATINEQKTIISEKEETIDHHVADISQLKSNASSLLKKTNDDAKTIAEQKKVIDRHVADIGEARNNASALRQQMDELKAVIASRGVDINRLKNKIHELAPEQTSVLLLGGWHGDITNSTTIYNSMEKSWKNCRLTLPSTLARHGAAILNNEIYIFGGYEDWRTKEPLKSLYKLGAGNKWERMADMTEERDSLPQSYVIFNSEIWVIGGWNETNSLKSVEKYNPKTKKWTKMPNLNESRAAAAATVIDGKIYVSGGWDGWKTKNSVEVYDPKKGKWEIFTPSLPYVTNSHILIGNHSHLIAIGGDLSNKSQQIEPTSRVWKIDVLDPKREWKEMPYLRQRRYHSGAAIIDDELMVFGGSINNANRIDSVEFFDGVEWKNGASLPEKRGSFAYIPLTWAQERLFLKRFCQNS